MRRVVGFSKLLLAILLPLCIWGMISALLMHLVEVRSIFIHGGEWRLRQALLSFAVAVILIQRISRMLGKGTARIYAVVLGVAITAFNVYMAWAYLLPTPPWQVFLASEILCVILWLVASRISSSCWTDSATGRDTAAETGILARIRIRRELGKKKLSRQEEEARWKEKLPERHPGRWILYFALVAVPAFGLGIYLFDMAEASVRIRMGIYLFLYLFSTFSLLSLSSLSQLADYFEKRGVTLPEEVGIPWLSISFVVVAGTLILAFFLPQPPTMSTGYVRERLVANYRGWESRYGMKEKIGRGMEKTSGKFKRAPLDRKSARKVLDKRYQKVDQLGDEQISRIHRDSGIEPEYRNVLEFAATTNEVSGKVFDLLIKILLVIMILAGLVVLYIVVTSLVGSLGYEYRSWRDKKAKRRVKPVLKRKKKRRRKKFAPALERFGKMPDPFSGTQRSGDALVRYLWEAFLAFCTDYGNPCEADKTPLEFVSGKPEAIEGFEDSALYIADLFSFSEYSGEKVPDGEIPKLKKFWSDLQKHAYYMAR